MTRFDIITLPRDVRKRWYYVITMPVDVNNQGPAELDMGVTLTYEVWDQELTTHASYQYLPDAINEAERLNEIYHGIICP